MLAMWGVVGLFSMARRLELETKADTQTRELAHRVGDTMRQDQLEDHGT